MTSKTVHLPILPLRDIVVFPHMIVPLFVGRDKSVHALEKVMQDDKKIMLVTQKDASLDDPKEEDLYKIGVIGTVLQLLKLPDGTVKVLIEGGERSKVKKIDTNEEYFSAIVEPYDVNDHEQGGKQLEAVSRAVLVQFEQYIKLNKKIPAEVLPSLKQISDYSKLSDTIASHLPLKISQKQELLESITIKDRLEKIYAFMEGEIDVLEVERKIRKRVKKQMEKTQRDYYLNEQMKAIQKELSDGDDDSNELQELQEKIEKVGLTKAAKKRAYAELKKLKNMSPMSAEATVVRNYLDWIISVPWKKRSRVSSDLKKAEKILNTDHYGLEKVKERIIEYIAVQKRTKKIRGPILCLVGPPGVGKTSLGQSIARATGRKFVRVALGGVRDESEIRGHRRTYIGAMPGKLVQGMKKAGTANPVFMLDEIDKMGMDFRGDPSSALLEVLDPEQNKSFNDHYLELDYDLSDVMFVCTANSMNIPRPLMDRMEIIRVSGYTEQEKIEIARGHLIAKQMEMNGLKDEEFTITDDGLTDLIRYYTREAGVRGLERELANLCRKATRKIMSDDVESVEVNAKNLNEFSGVRKYRFGEIEEKDALGVTTGLAWTEVGGDMLTIEAVTIPGKGKVSMTGKLGDVMKESITAAEMLIKSRAVEFGIDPDIFKSKNIHIHVPEGGTPKDGPSAGIAMVTSIVSVLSNNPVRKDVAMTGEITLRGRVFAIGGLKEKLLAALRGGIKKVLIPIDNAKDLVEIPDIVKDGLEIIPVQGIQEVLEHALVSKPKPFLPQNKEDSPTIDTKPAENLQKDTIHH